MASGSLQVLFYFLWMNIWIAYFEVILNLYWHFTQPLYDNLIFYKIVFLLFTNFLIIFQIVFTVYGYRNYIKYLKKNLQYQLFSLVVQLNQLFWQVLQDNSWKYLKTLLSLNIKVISLKLLQPC